MTYHHYETLIESSLRTAELTNLYRLTKSTKLRHKMFITKHKWRGNKWVSVQQLANWFIDVRIQTLKRTKVRLNWRKKSVYWNCSSLVWLIYLITLERCFHHILELFFGQWQHARGLSVHRTISKRSPSRATQKSAAPAESWAQKVEISVPVRMGINNQIDHWSGDHPRSPTWRLQMDHWLTGPRVSPQSR